MAVQYGHAMKSSAATDGREMLAAIDRNAVLAAIDRPLVDLRTGEPVEVPRRLAYKPVEVAEMLGVGRSYVFILIKTKQLKSVKLANRRMVLAEDLREFVENLTAVDDSARGAA